MVKRAKLSFRFRDRFICTFIPLLPPHLPAFPRKARSFQRPDANPYYNPCAAAVKVLADAIRGRGGAPPPLPPKRTVDQAVNGPCANPLYQPRDLVSVISHTMVEPPSSTSSAARTSASVTTVKRIRAPDTA